MFFEVSGYVDAGWSRYECYMGVNDIDDNLFNYFNIFESMYTY